MPEDYKQAIKARLQDEDNFVRLTLKGRAQGQQPPYRRITVRPVLIKGDRYLQFSYFTERQDITKNYKGNEAEEKLEEALAMPFSLIQLETTEENLQVQIVKGGKAILHRSPPTVERQPDLAHDRAKDLPLPAGKPDSFLQAVGIMNKQGGVIPSMQDKFSQVNEFLKLLEHTGELQKLDKTPVNILDCGAGSSYLSFAVYHYINDILDIPTNLVGVEVNEKLVEKSNAYSERLGYPNICFQKSAIIDYVPEAPPDIVLALHACDTATDEAIAQGILHTSRLVLCVPCCHHEMHTQLEAKEPFEPVFEQGILKQRLGDILTDTFRAQILRIMGYKTDVVEFVSSEHTDRNLMIRAAKRGEMGNKELAQEYADLKAFWEVTPYLEKLLAERGAWPG